MSSDEDCCIISSYPSNSATSSDQNKIISSSLSEFTCPICSETCKKLSEIEAHIENEHLGCKGQNSEDQLNSSSPCMEHACPVCSQIFKDSSLLESHFHAKHDMFISESSSQAVAASFCCPVCLSDEFCSEEVLALHVNQHFLNEFVPQGDEDEQLARQLEEQERALMQNQEREDFKRLQSLHGFDQGRNMNRQSDATLFRSVQQGNISAVDYHEKRIMLKMSENLGVDGGSSATRDIIPLIRRHATTPNIYTCSTVDHYAASFGDSGWGCGYRNLQMLLSALLRHPQYIDRLATLCPSTSSTSGSLIQVPSITRLQSAIEEAWKLGFDQQGCGQLGNKLTGTCKWIGATEIAALLASCRINYQLIDFHRPTSADGKLHPALFDWVKGYFQGPSEFKAPLYFQHQGHSRTIIGIEEGRQGKMRLLILDPSHKCDQMRLLTDSSNPAQSNVTAKKIWVPMTSLRARQYQIVCVNGGFLDDDREYRQSQLIRSTRIP